MIVLDTHVVVWHALQSQKVSARAKKAIKSTPEEKGIVVSEISFWEIAMMLKRGRLQIDVDDLAFMNLLCSAFVYQFKGITPEISSLSVNLPDEINRDPADRLICATALVLGAPLVTADKNLRASKIIKTVW